ncbi:cytosolic carboxypeptidase Nna1 isoform X2 [Aethina tumida]|uniref:cytosolic carboxypeptidase Nna1 isoform X2 n=1 Tax=Aethina tumida TaxID=116153 RepID=UPI00096B06CE|nr:cytosolic carboxypeptidase Nna1 isoform X2 [Aethina tumida]
MNLENESDKAESQVKSLQATLFPPQYTGSASFFSNFLVKNRPPYSENEDDDCRNRVRESISKELFGGGFKEHSFSIQPPRWPTECQVLDERVTHISYVPPTVEPYYVVTGTEVQPKPVGDECGIIVFQYNPISAVNYFSRSSVGGSKYLLSSNLCPEEDSLKFESRFECGNLARAVRITSNYYELHLRSDLYTNRHMQWFYFRVTNMKKRYLYRFSIVNFSKENSLYNEGMRPVMYSKRDAQLHSIGWRRCGDNITYYSNDNVSPDDPDQQMTYTLTFTMEFPHEKDEVYIANCYPYTYSDLQDYLHELSIHPIKSVYTSVRLLCKTLAGNNVYYITITSPPNSGDNPKRAIVLTARVHPGETPSSWMMKGCLDFLTSDAGPAKELREKFIFKIVPMLNPDGVIVGNNRCSLAAKDLNRQYRTVIRDAYPSIWYTKLMVRRLLEDCGVALYCDFHAHSRRHNIFIYGCETRRGAERRLQEQVFPLMLHKNTADKFSFESCTFRIQKAKEGTGRVVMWMMGIANSYTLEATFAGSTLGNRADTHFNTQDYEQMGKSFCQTLLDYYDDDPKKEKLREKIVERLFKEGSNADEPTNIRLSDYSSDDGDSSSTSSNEVGRGDGFPTVPPPSPEMVYPKRPVRQKIVHVQQQQSFKSQKVVVKSPSAPRKPLPICKTVLGLSLNNCYGSESDSDSADTEQEFETVKKGKKSRRRRRKKKSIKKKEIHGDSDTELTTKKNGVTVCDLIPSQGMMSEPNIIRSKTPQPITNKSQLQERKNIITHQLAEVQAKLMSLKNKLWFGMKSEEPLSWGHGGGVFVPPDMLSSPQKKNRKKRSDKKPVKDPKPAKKKPIGLKRQTAIDVPMKKNNLSKSKSLPDKLASYEKQTYSCDEQKETTEKKKKKRKGKLLKKAKVMSHARIFTKD